MKKIIVLLCSILIFSYMIKSNDSKEVVIPDEAIRFRVVAASNTIYDQNVKIQVRNEVQNRILELLKNVESINDIRRIINEHKEEKLNKASVKIKDKYGTKSVIKGMNLEQFATTIKRNAQIGGHNA